MMYSWLAYCIKWAIDGTTSTVLSFGENDNCLGYLIGEPGHGLKYMFKMMNEARVGVGVGRGHDWLSWLSGISDYAKNRPQGRPVIEKTPDSKPVNIIEHTDVKRMLLAQKSYVEGSLALCLFAAPIN